MIGFIAPFQILDHIERLNVVKENSHEYHCTCPVCGDGGFKIDKKSGKYQGFKCGCEVKEIREAIRPRSELRADGKENRGRKRIPSPSPQIKIAKLPDNKANSPQPESKPIPNWLQNQGIPAEAKETQYWYSKSQWVSRFEWETKEGKEKTIRQGHIKSNGLKQWKKGDKDWKAYKLSETIKHCANKWVLALEGEGCVETSRALGLAAITWQGSNWQKENITSDLTILIDKGTKGLVYFPDFDSAGEKKAKLVKSACEQVNLPCLILSPTEVWTEMPEKGDITDWVKANPELSTDELVKRLSKAIALTAQKEEQERLEKEEKEKVANLPKWSQSEIAKLLAEKYREGLVWDTTVQEWYIYGAEKEGIWSIKPVEVVGNLVIQELDKIALLIAKNSQNNKKPTYTVSMVNGLITLLKMKLWVSQWEELEGVIPLLNGVLDLETRKLMPHSPENGLKWCLPYKYNILATCEPIQDWLLTMCGGDRDLVELMRAYLLGIVTGRNDWQKYLELIGGGGTGKSTFTRLATALVGKENVHTTTLHKLEKEKFETASIANKRLVLMNDAERYAGSVSKLKALTGQDTLPYEQKHKQSTGGFTPKAMVIVAANETIQSGDYTSGLERRRMTVPMFNKISSENQRNLIEHRNGEIEGEFAPYIPGLLNWVLAMDKEEATRIIKNYQKAVPSLALNKAKTLVETNPIADWLDSCIVYDSTAKTNVGVAKRDKDSNSPSWYLNTERWLYASYCERCHNTGTRPVSLRRFVTLLSDLGKNQLDLDIKRERDRYGSYFVGLKIRTDSDKEPLMITGNSEVVVKDVQPSSSTNVITNLWTMVMDKVTDVIDSVMDESLDSDELKECDGKNENYSELESSVEPEKECNTKKSLQTKFSKMPSHPLEKEGQTKTNQGVTDSSSTYHQDQNPSSDIKVGDQVTVSDCPAHWLWASPFIVESIDGQMVTLEMVDQLVELGRLSVVE